MGDVVDIADGLRNKSKSHAALKKIAKQMYYCMYYCNPANFADYVMLELWNKGFKIVPRDDTGSIDA